MVAACLAWAIDNNFTRVVSSADPVHIAALKGLVAGTVNVAIALGRGVAWPPWDVALGAAVVGLLGYGTSLVLFVHALRHLGAGRTAAYFSTAPFIGAVVAIVAFPFVAVGLAVGHPEPSDEVVTAIDTINRYNDDARRKEALCAATAPLEGAPR